MDAGRSVRCVLVDVLVTGSHGSSARRSSPRSAPTGTASSASAAEHRRARTTCSGIPTPGPSTPPALEGVDAVVHLAGAGIGDKKWTPRTQAARSSTAARGAPTLLARTLAGLTAPAGGAASRARRSGYYGEPGRRGARPRRHRRATTSRPGSASPWEAATAPAPRRPASGWSTIRTGIVLAAHGGALHRMLLPFKLGLGGRIGSGEQYMSWIALDDHVGGDPPRPRAPSRCAGPVNLTAPNPATNAEFTRALGAAVHRPTVLPTPLLPLKARVRR